MRQRTLKESIRASGIGLHCGEKVYMTLRPAPANAGIVFRRLDLPEPIDLPADALQRHRDDTRYDARAQLGEGRHHRASNVGDGRVGDRQCVRRSDGGRGADHGRQCRAVRVPAAVCRYRGAQCAEAVHPSAEAHRGPRRRQVGAARPAQRFPRQRRDRLRASGAAQVRAIDVDGLLDAGVSRRKSVVLGRLVS